MARGIRPTWKRAARTTGSKLVKAPLREKPPRIEDERLVTFVMRTFGRSRWTQDSPIVPDVWLAYLRTAELDAFTRIRSGGLTLGKPIERNVRTPRVELLITPWSGVSAGELAHRLRGSIDPCWIAAIEKASVDEEIESVVSKEAREARIAAGASRVAADLDLETLLAVVLPETGWWMSLQPSPKVRDALPEKDRADVELLRPDLRLLNWLAAADGALDFPNGIEATETEEMARFVCLVGLVRSFTACRTFDDYADLDRRVKVLMGPIFDQPLGDGFPIGRLPSGKGTVEVRAESMDAYRFLHLGWTRVAPERRIWLDALLRARRHVARRSAERSGIIPDEAADRDAETQQYEQETARIAEREKTRNAVWMVNRNRTADRAVMTSRQTIKADASIRVFDVAGDNITFAVIDDGIDATHAAFYFDPKADPDAQEDDGAETGRAGDAGTDTMAPAAAGATSASRRGKKKAHSEKTKVVPAFPVDRLKKSRVIATYDFTVIRDILVGIEIDRERRAKFRCALRSMAEKRLDDLTKRMRRRIEDARNIDWDIVERMIRVTHDGDYFLPSGGHGTHVAGIMAADWERSEDDGESVLGICPRMRLYDLRVFDADGRTDEFAVLCALEFVQWINKYREAPVIHGVNLSLAMVHDISNFACGQTPVCDAANRLVGAGVVVVAAAGNFGYGGNAAAPKLGDAYRPSSITDPGNAEMVITVGSTHRRDPHAYGVSYFSARGPTGDGRRKPDLLAPGEKITSTAPGDITRCLDGTSMAAPHVAGAAALMMARHPELIGNPCRIKEILMRSATDLGREPYFQGAGVLDVLRAMQAV